jgi:CHAT domain-containing protein
MSKRKRRNMAEPSPVDNLVAEFFQAVNLRKLALSHSLLTLLDEMASTQPQARPWAQYCRGILAFEETRDWGAAERIFNSMLASRLTFSMHARVLYALGRTYLIQGRWQEAIDTYEQLLQKTEPTGQPLEVVKARRQLAVCYCRGYASGDLDKTLLPLGVDHCRSALALLSQHVSTGESQQLTWLAGSVWNTLGILYSYLQDWQEARSCFEQDLACCEALDDRHGMGLTFNNLGEVYHRQGDEHWAEALAMYTRALELVREFGNVYEEIDVLGNVARLHADMDEYAAARARYTRAIELIEQLRTGVSSEEGRTGFFSTVAATYAALVDLLINGGELGQAFDMTERARSRTFLELLSSHPASRATPAPEALVEREERLRARIENLYGSKSPATEPDSENLNTLEEALADVQRRLRLFDPDYGDLQQVTPLTHPAIQARLPQTAALLAYFDAGTELVAFAITAERLSVQRLALTATELRRAFDDQGHLDRLTPTRDGRLLRPWILEQLAARLVAPLADRLQGCERLIILPAGQLHFVPFSALPFADDNGGGRLLGDTFEVVYAPSATLLLEHCQQLPLTTGPDCVALGYGAGDLRYAHAEAAAVAHLFEKPAFVDHAATRATLFKEAPNARRLHLSCHGRFHGQAPLASHLLLADGPLYAADILHGLRLQAELVTLSACESGRSQVLPGEELIGLVRAFFYAGTASVLVTLWPVDEVSTILLMLRFYTNLRNGLSKTAALRDAQLHLRQLTKAEAVILLKKLGIDDVPLPPGSSRTPIFAHPYFWAPFVLMGDSVLVRDDAPSVAPLQAPVPSGPSTG